MKKFFLILLIIIIVLIFRVWFLPTTLVGGDTVNINSMDLFNPIPYLWDIHNNNGFGSFVGPFLNAQMVTSVLWFLGNILHLDWSSLERIVFLFPEIILGIFISTKFANYFLGKKVTNTLAPLIFLLNTYFLLLLAGGQIVVAFSYILLPYVFYRFVILFESLLQKDLDYKSLLRSSVIASLMLSIEIIFDIRFAFLVVFIIGLYGLYKILFSFSIVRKRVGQVIIYTIVVPLFAIISFHAFWIVPTLMVHQNTLQQLGSGYTSIASVQFLSFAKFENAIGLLHPNWPENIFGKVYFMRPEFLLMPILAFSSLLSIKTTKDKKNLEKNRNLLFFALLGILGAYLSKGANDPFGSGYVWMFNHIPGFVMFRDSTKWYIFIILSYMALIPFSIGKIAQFAHEKFAKVRLSQSGIVLVVIVLFCWTIKPAFVGEIPGLLQTHTIPTEYNFLASHLSSDKKFSRVMWVPVFERYGYFSRQHPTVDAQTFFQASSVPQILKALKTSSVKGKLQLMSIRYIVIPYDVEGEIFVKDRKYDNAQYLATISSLRKIPWLKEISGFGRIHVFEVSNAKDHFWINDQGASISYQSINPTKYMLTIKNAKKGDKVVFTDSFDNHWEMLITSQSIASAPFENSLNSFVLPKGGTYSATIYYTPQKWVNIGAVVSLATLLGLTGFLVYSFTHLDKSHKLY